MSVLLYFFKLLFAENYFEHRSQAKLFSPMRVFSVEGSGVEKCFACDQCPKPFSKELYKIFIFFQIHNGEKLVSNWWETFCLSSVPKAIFKRALWNLYLFSKSLFWETSKKLVRYILLVFFAQSYFQMSSMKSLSLFKVIVVRN